MSGLWKTLKVAAKKKEADYIVSFELIDPASEPLPRFTAGAHIDVEIAPDLVRQYSLCNAPRERCRYLIGVLRERASRGGSTTLVDTVERARSCAPASRATISRSICRRRASCCSPAGSALRRSCAWPSIWPLRRPRSSCITVPEVARGRHFLTASGDRHSRIARASISTMHRDPCSSI